MVQRLFQFVLVLMLGVGAWQGVVSQAQAGETNGLVAPAGSDSVDAGHVVVKAAARAGVVKPGEDVVVAVVLDHMAGFHTYPAASVKLPKNIDELAIRTTIVISSPEEVAKSAWKIQWPKTHETKVLDPSGDAKITLPLYSGRAIAYVVIPGIMQPGEYQLKFVVSYQACNDLTCDPPEEKEIAVAIKVDAAGGVGSESEEIKNLFAEFKAGSAVSPVMSQASGEQTGSSETATGATSATTPVAPLMEPTILGYQLAGGAVVLFLASALGGLILNLTPCVLPVIPIKVMTLVQHANTKTRALVLGMWMTSGVVAFWTVIGVPMAFISTSLDPSQYIFGIWWITFSLGLLIAVMGLGIMGLFTLNLPQSIYMIDAKADTPLGSFLFGVLAAVLGLPCFGFVAGGLLAAASTMPAVSIMAIFVGLGVGMGSPYLVLSAKPQLLRFIPRTGPTSELVKQVMGVLLLAASAFFITAGIQGLLSERPYLSGSMAWWAVGFFIFLAGIWMTIRTIQIAKSRIAKVVFPALAALMIVGITVFAQRELDKDRQNWMERQQAMAQLGGAGLTNIPSGVWFPYTPELFSAVRAANRPVFLEFTASYCLNCKVLKAKILDAEPVKSAFRDRGVVILEVDTTARSGPGAKKLTELGRTGIPTWAVYGPGAQEPLFVAIDSLSSHAVLETLDKAGVSQSKIAEKNR